MNKIKFKIKEVKPRIFLAEFEDIYDMCMTFMRYQEFYESPNPKFRNKPFEIFDFMKWYSHSQGRGGFSYAADWVGFNIPSKIIDKCLWNVNTTLDYDRNLYDDVMEDIQFACITKTNLEGDDFYLIGALKGNERTIQHEVAHGMFYLVPEYKKEMMALLKKLKPKFRDQLYKDLQKVGYTKHVLPDEAQAFLSTGWREYFPELHGEDAPFIKVFDKHYKGK